jgi:hypothetical protein
MMNLTPLRALSVPLRGVALLALLVALAAGWAGAALSDESSTPSHPDRVAVLVSADAPAAALAAATAHASRDGAAVVEVRRAGGPWEAQAAAAALGAQGLDEVIAVGADARTAAGQAASSALGSATRWTTSG